jgi:hypothetical protein
MITRQQTAGVSSLDFYYYSFVIFGPLGIVSNVIFLIGIGMYFSTRLKSSTAAVMATIGSLLGFYVIRQFFVTFLFAILGVMMMGNIQFALISRYIFSIVFNALIGTVLLRQAKYRLRLDIF